MRSFHRPTCVSPGAPVTGALAQRFQLGFRLGAMTISFQSAGRGRRTGKRLPTLNPLPFPGTPAGAYTTASGFDYQTVIPEQMTASLRLLSLFAPSLALARRRRE